MRRYLALVFLLCLSIPAGLSITGCVRNPAGAYCNGLGYGLKNTDVYAITLQPYATGISMAYGQTRSITPPTATTCKGTSVAVGSYTYGTTNYQLIDISPTGNMCAGTWNRNSGGGIPDYTICNYPNPLPNTGGLPYTTVFISASADSVVSNPVEVYVHAPVSSIALAQQTTSPYGCYSQGTIAQLDSEACYAGPNNAEYEFCAPPTVTQSATPHYACPSGLAPGVPAASIQDCTSTIGILTYAVGTPSVASINPQTNQITAELPGTTVITASVAQSGSSAGFFSTCPPRSISVTLANGNTSGTVTQGVSQNLTTSIVDTTGATITGLSLDYQSTNPLEITAGAGGTIVPSFPGAASIYAVCQPATCNPTPINQVGLYGTGVSLSSNPVDITTPGTASAFMWFAAPGRSQYVVPVQLLSGTPASTIRLPYVPNSMIMDQTGTNIYLGSSHALMVINTASDSVTTQNTSVPGVVLAVAPNAQTVLINDQVRQVFYLYNSSGTVTATFGGMGAAASWTPDSKTLYITDSAALGGNHSDTLYVYNANTGWTTCSAGQPCAGNFDGATDLALTVPGVGAYLGGTHTVARSWCPAGTVGNYSSMVFYPEAADIVNTSNNQVESDALAATTDGKHVLGAAYVNDSVTLSDISVTIPTSVCPSADSGETLEALPIPSTLNPQQTLNNISASSVNQVVTSPAGVTQGTAVSPSILSFITYNPGPTANGLLPYYTQTTGSSAPGTIGYLTLTAPPNGPSPTAPVAGAFSPDNTLFFVSTAGDNMIHYISTQSILTSPANADTQQLSPNLPACVVGSDPDCVLTNSTEPASGIVPATAIVVKPRSTT